MPESNKQKDAFTTYEADAWFERNKTFLLEYTSDTDNVVKLIREYDLDPESLLEIGCSAGYRLNGLKKIFKACKVHGIEPSRKAIEFGRSTYPDIDLTQGTADNLEKYPDNS